MNKKAVILFTAALLLSGLISACTLPEEPANTDIAVTGVTLNTDSITVTEGNSETLTATVLPEDAANKSVSWQSNHPEIASVSANGTVHAEAPGTAEITVTTEDGEFTDTCTVTVIQQIIQATGISLNKTSTAILAGNSEQLFVFFTPAGTTNQLVEWSSDNKPVADVSNNGTVTAYSAGTATITATSDDGGFSASCTVTVSLSTVAVTGVSLNKASTSIESGDSELLVVTISPANATNQSLGWSSTDDSIASVSTAGLVTAGNTGTATITVTSDDGGFTDTCTVTVVPVAVTGVELNKESTSIFIGSTEQLTAEISPTDAANQTVYWSTDDSDIATVSSTGFVTAEGAGTATITVTTDDGPYTDSCTVTVLPISVTGVELDPDSVTIYPGDTEQLSATVSPGDASDQTVLWSSSDNAIAEVSSSGLITAISPGIADITVTTQDNGFTDVCTVTVIPVPPFVSSWKTDNTGSSAPNQISLPLVSTGTYDCIVDWGDGLPTSEITAYDDPDRTHTYSSAGTYQVEISGMIEGWSFYVSSSDYQDARKLVGVSSWGVLSLGDCSGHFADCRYLVITATDAPDLSDTTSLHNTFYNCDALTDIPSLDSWDTSTITIMRAAFLDAENFNTDLNNWNTSNVTDMSFMFEYGIDFNGNISDWNTGNVVDMSYMFCWATSFNGDISEWNTEKVEDMNHMFNTAQDFNGDITEWKTGSVTDMSYMFSQASDFNCDISGWQTGNVEDMTCMFWAANHFNQDIGGWNTQKVTGMGSLFFQSAFNQDISTWDISNVTDMYYMFDSCPLSTANYDALLIAWADLEVQDGIHLDAGSIKYSSAATAARQSLIDDHSWTIDDGGPAP
ncbi:MAG: Ig-like domain-containing protein [Spirochaetales bacterium]|nr:Ig-like domain-containing protein [Spirochaetales bacterium]